MHYKHLQSLYDLYLSHYLSVQHLELRFLWGNFTEWGSSHTLPCKWMMPGAYFSIFLINHNGTYDTKNSRLRLQVSPSIRKIVRRTFLHSLGSCVFSQCSLWTLPITTLTPRSSSLDGRLPSALNHIQDYGQGTAVQTSVEWCLVPGGRVTGCMFPQLMIEAGFTLVTQLFVIISLSTIHFGI